MQANGVVGCGLLCGCCGSFGGIFQQPAPSGTATGSAHRRCARPVQAWSNTTCPAEGASASAPVAKALSAACTLCTPCTLCANCAANAGRVSAFMSTSKGCPRTGAGAAARAPAGQPKSLRADSLTKLMRNCRSTSTVASQAHCSAPKATRLGNPCSGAAGCDGVFRLQLQKSRGGGRLCLHRAPAIRMRQHGLGSIDGGQCHACIAASPHQGGPCGQAVQPSAACSALRALICA